MRLLVLGGTRFVGRAVAAEGVARGFDVTVLNRGVTGAPPEGVSVLTADRTAPGALAGVLGDASFDLVVDTWTGAPTVAGEAAQVLAGRAVAYAYVSSISVYEWGRHVDEASPTVDADPFATDGEYPQLKRGAELAVLRHVPDALLVRCGLILGPHEDVGRLPWWLRRIARGGRVVAPGRPGRALQYVDVRDLASFVLDALLAGRDGPVDTASPSGHATTGSLLAACVAVTGSDAEPVWVDEARLAEVGAAPWTELPCWVPEDEQFRGFMEADTSRAAEWGLRCRPVEDTVAGTWEWLVGAALLAEPPDGGHHGLPADKERALLGS
jgi:2'-hydroxyisoflavone reductase